MEDTNTPLSQDHPIGIQKKKNLQDLSTSKIVPIIRGELSTRYSGVIDFLDWLGLFFFLSSHYSLTIWMVFIFLANP